MGITEFYLVDLDLDLVLIEFYWVLTVIHKWSYLVLLSFYRV